MRLLGFQSMRLRLLCGVACLVAACSPYLERESPGIFYDVQLPASAPTTLCLEFANDVTAQTNLQVKWQGPLERPDECGALLNERTDAPVREVWITMDAARSVLFVDLRELDAAGPEQPSRQTKELGEQLARLIHERFPSARVTQGKRFSGLVTP